MKAAKSDPRFAHIASDRRFKPIKPNKVAVSLDDKRFAELNQVTSIHGIQDPRGRKFNVRNHVIGRGNSGHLVKETSPHHSVDDDEECGDSDDGGGKEDNDSDDDNVVDCDDQDSDDEVADSEDNVHNNADSEDEGESEDGEEEGDYDTTVDKADIVEFEDMEDNEDNIQNMNKAMQVSVVEQDTLVSDMSKRRLQQLLDPKLDIARGVDQYSGESSSDDSESDDEDDVAMDMYNWGETDKDAQWDVDGHEVQETHRLAVCNIEWQKFKAEDILMILKSFAPDGGDMRRVCIYMSDFGRERVQEELAMGPKEIRDLPIVKENDEGEKVDYEALRRYHFNSLKCYYAIAECDNIQTAKAIYQALDGTALECANKVDLRYVPDDMTFDYSPESECAVAPANYNSALIEGRFAAGNYVNTQLTWDEDNIARTHTIEALADAHTFDNEQQIGALLAGDSESDDDDGVEDYLAGRPKAFEITTMPECEAPKENSSKAKKNKFRWLISNMHKFNHVQEAETKLLARTLGDKAYENRPPIVMYNEDEHGGEQEDDDCDDEDEDCAEEGDNDCGEEENEESEFSGEEENEESEFSDEEEAGCDVQEEFLTEPIEEFSDADEPQIKKIKRSTEKQNQQNTKKKTHKENSILNNINTEDDDVDKEEELTDSEDESEEQNDSDDDKGLTPFEKYLQKRKRKQKEHKKAKKAKLRGNVKEKDNSFADIPDDLKNDPFFKEEMKLRKKEKMKREQERRDEEDKLLVQQRLDMQRREKEMSLLMFDEGQEGPQQADMRQVVKLAAEAEATGGKKKKMSRWKLAKIAAKEKRLAKKGVMLPELSATEQQKTIVIPEPKTQAKSVIENSRFAGIYEDHRGAVDSSHPEYLQHKTPFLEKVASEIQQRAVRNSKRKRNQL